MSKNLVWDTIFSTYWWEIELNPAHSENNGKGHRLTGYSKAQGQAENRDKHNLLMVKILMLIRMSYLKRCNKISFYEKRNSFIEKKADTLILELVPNDFCIYPEYRYDRLDLSKFLKTIYQDVLTGKSVEYLLPLKKEIKKDHSLDVRLDIHKYYFTTFHELQSHCEKLAAEGFPAQMVKHFLTKYVEKYPNLESKFYKDSEGFNRVVQTISNKFNVR